MIDLFGNEIPDVDPPAEHAAADRAHPYPPRSGPDGKTCRTCDHYCRVGYHGKHWRKCGRMSHLWTHGPGTDIKASDPACQLYEEGTENADGGR